MIYTLHLEHEGGRGNDRVYDVRYGALSNVAHALTAGVLDPERGVSCPEP